MKEIENIFSNSPVKKISCPNPKIPVIIDTREKQSLIAANLIERKANIKFEKLEIGDYMISNIVIERKTFSDFLSSIVNKRLQKQLVSLRKYDNCFLILENFHYNYNDFNMHENAIRGMILSIITNFKIPIIYTKNEEDTSKFLITLAKRCEKNNHPEISIRQNKTPQTLFEKKQFILEGFPGIGPTTAKAMIGKFKTLRRVFGSLPEELKELGLNELQIKNFLEIMND